jgi:hypothetical protein
MTPEAYQGRSEDRYELTEESPNGVQVDTVTTVYADLVARIDSFLQEPRNDLRQGTQAKIRVSIQVIEKALKDYGFFLYLESNVEI